MMTDRLQRHLPVLLLAGGALAPLVNLDRPINITGGPSGLISIDPPSFFGYVIERNIQYYYLFLTTLAAVLFISIRLRDSRIGWAWQAIREDELAAAAMGVNTTVA